MSEIRYAQCWEDADVLLDALDVQPGDTCLSIASAGDNTLALLARAPSRVIAIDYSSEQIACLELRVAAYRELSHRELLELVGSVPGSRRGELYQRCRKQLSSAASAFWDARPDAIAGGIGGAGRIEHYLALFRRSVLPWVHSHRSVARLLGGGCSEEREAFYMRGWDNWRWRLVFRMFFSRTVMSRLGRDPRFFRYANGAVAEHLLTRARHALTTLDPAQNPYLQWIAAGRHLTALPFALRPENFEPIRARLDRLEWHCSGLDDYLANAGAHSIDRFNLSDVFEYMSPAQYESMLEQLARTGRPGGRLVYWNLLVDRHRPDRLGAQLIPLRELARQLYRRDKAFFYDDLVIEEIAR
jgi:S-adenosylmethionine-diacylglycerol 3-amino-3-carboxypropyl transferase